MKNSYRKNSIFVGILFLMGFLGVPSLSLLNPVLKAADPLVSAATHETQFISGVFLLVLMAFACAGMAIGLYPVLKKHCPAMALGAVGFRLLEAGLFLFASTCLLALVSVGHSYMAAGASGASGYQAAGVVLLSLFSWSMNLLGLLAWDIGALLYYIAFYKSRLIPRWLSAWGVIGIVLSMLAGVLSLYSVIRPDSTIQSALNIPVAIQELIFAGWLIGKGYNRSALLEET